MAAQIIDGKAVAQATRSQVAARVQQRLAAGKRAPGLAGGAGRCRSGFTGICWQQTAKLAKKSVLCLFLL